jgi:hypothetical protein
VVVVQVAADQGGILSIRHRFLFFAWKSRTSCARRSTSATSSPEDAVRRADHMASPWLDLAEGRLRLDRLSRNDAGSTFFP